MPRATLLKQALSVVGLAVAWVLPGGVVSAAAGLARAETPAPPPPWDSGREAVPSGRIDEQVFSRLGSLGLKPAHLCSDSAFLRRVYLDTLGLPPTRAEALRFLEDTRTDKRSLLIDELLGRPEFSDYWAMRWADLLRVKAEYPVNLWPNAAQAYHRWIHDALQSAMPMDRFARELLVSSGSNFRVGQVNFYRAMQSREPRVVARMVALTFLGERAEQWPSARLDGLAGFFSQLGFKATGEWKEEIVYWDASKAAVAAPASVYPDGAPAVLPPGKDPRLVFADWLEGPGGPAFRRCLANRVWYWLLGRGLVQEPDDFRVDNPPSHPELLEFLAEDLGSSGNDLRHLCRRILQSQTYQLSCTPASTAASAPETFAVYPLRRLDAEVLIDAIDAITGTHSRYQSAIPEPYTYVPENIRATQLPDGSISSAFLEMFGRPPRDTGLASERNSRISAVQQLHLLNSSQVRRKLEQGPLIQALIKDYRGKPGQFVEAAYLSLLARRPSAEERRLVMEHSKQGGATPRDAAQDLLWALLNSDEFLFQH